MNKIIPKKENADKGFYYSVSDEQIAAHQKRTPLEIITWLEETAKFIYSLQTPEEHRRAREIKGKIYYDKGSDPDNAV